MESIIKVMLKNQLQVVMVNVIKRLIPKNHHLILTVQNQNRMIMY